MTPDERAQIVEMLEDPSLSFRAISRMTGISDWTIRKVARELDGDPRPMKQRRSVSREPSSSGEEGSPLPGWLVFGGVVALFGVMIWAGWRWMPPEV